VSGTRKAAGSAALVLVDGAVPLRPEPALFEAMLEGWRRQQGARRLSGPLVEGRVRLVRRFAAFTGAWPWQWTEVPQIFRTGNPIGFSPERNGIECQENRSITLRSSRSRP
jgi:hypothetical protein